jgi:hypothetical protein
VTEQDFHSHFGTNVLGVILATQEAVKAFDDTGQHDRQHEPIAQRILTEIVSDPPA